MTSKKSRRLICISILVIIFIVFLYETTIVNQSVNKIDKNQIKTQENILSQFENWAKNDHISLLKYCLDNYKYKDYCCLFVKREIINGKDHQEQAMSVRFMQEPFSVSMMWVKNPPAGDRVIYVEGKYNNMMLVRPTSSFARKLCPVAKRQPDGEEALKNTLRPITLFGFKRNLESLLNVYIDAKNKNELKEEFGGFFDIGVENRKTIALIRYLPNKPEYPAKKTIIYIDLEWKVPLIIEAYDWDDKFQSKYEFRYITFDTELKDEDFLPEYIME